MNMKIGVGKSIVEKMTKSFVNPNFVQLSSLKLNPFAGGV